MFLPNGVSQGLVTSIYIGFAAASPLFSAPNEGLSKRTFTEGTGFTTAQPFSTFTSEYNAGVAIAQKIQSIRTADSLVDDFHYETFIPFEYQNEDQATEYLNTYLGKFISLGGDSSYTVTVNNAASSDSLCASVNGREPYAYTTPSTKTMTLCPAFWSSAPLTSEVVCDDRTLDEFESKAMTIMHEFGHLKGYFSLQHGGTPPFQDFAYGSAECQALAESDADEAINNADNWMFVALGIYWSDKCGRTIPPNDPETGFYAGIDGASAPGCVPGNPNEWILSSGDTCNGARVNKRTDLSPRDQHNYTWSGPGGCDIPNTGGMFGINVADCHWLPVGTTVMEITLEVTNATKGYYTDYAVTIFGNADCTGHRQQYEGPASNQPLVGGDYLYQSGCFEAPSGQEWRSYLVWNITGFEALHGPLPSDTAQF